MSRKHFRAIAAAIATITDSAERQRVAKLLAAVCASLNPEFKRSVFLSACGVVGH
jgi:hypothetical protein